MLPGRDTVDAFAPLENRQDMLQDRTLSCCPFLSIGKAFEGVLALHFIACYNAKSTAEESAFMANPEHVEHCKQGVDAWNYWRRRNLGVLPDLSSVDLSHADFSRANLSHTNLSWANLNGTILQNADLSHADLSRTYLVAAHLGGAHLGGAHLRYANLSHANLSHAILRSTNLREANLSYAVLRNADLNHADLNGADLSHAYLRNADFHTTRFSYTIFAWVDLCAIEGLDTVIHNGPSSVDVKTVQLPEGETRIHFLRGAGFSDTFIDYLPALLTAAIQYESCFISYAHQDEALAQRLYKDLQNKGVRCWFAPEDMKIGDRIRSRIDQAIHLQEKLLLLLSEHSLTSSWVEVEVEAALEKEQRQGCDVLFPVRLDDAVMHTSQAWAATLRRMRHIGDLTNWQDDAVYQQRLAELLNHLKVQTA
jgi:hypothetical protein